MGLMAVNMLQMVKKRFIHSGQMYFICEICLDVCCKKQIIFKYFLQAKNLMKIEVLSWIWDYQMLFSCFIYAVSIAARVPGLCSC